jgi:putative colanic acid biosynthesis UDP-glucose lipid carrier transferase
MNQRLLRMVRLAFILIDLLILNIIFLFTIELFAKNISVQVKITYTYFLFAANIGWLGASWLNSIYQSQNIAVFEIFCKKTIRAYLYFLVFSICYIFFFQQSDISRSFVGIVLSAIATGLIFSRLGHLFLFQYFLNKNYLVRKIVVIGYNALAKKLVQHLEDEPIKNEIVGFCEDEKNVKELTHYPVITNLQNVMEFSVKNEVTEIYSTIAPETNKEIYSLIEKADELCIRFRFIPDLNSFIRQPIHIEYIGQMPMLSVRKEPLNDVANRIRQRLYDLVFTTLVIVFILSWLIPILSLLVLLDSRGPVFFVQRRTGVNNKPFNCIKFRSMRKTSDADVKQATKGDHRITRLGRILRKTNLDELPQFFNVLVSDMSIVGPRPHMIKHTVDYSKVVNQYMVRQFLKPGITGWAQISGYRGETKTLDEMQARVQHDLWYLENWSLWLDTKIILMTCLNMFKGEKNAY